MRPNFEEKILPKKWSEIDGFLAQFTKTALLTAVQGKTALESESGIPER